MTIARVALLLVVSWLATGVVLAQPFPGPSSFPPPTPTPGGAPARDEAGLAQLLARSPDNRVFRAEDGTVVGLAGDLADPEQGELEAAARAFVKARGGALGVPTGVTLRRSDLQDGTPVRLVRFRPQSDGAEMPSGEIQVTYDRAGRVIGFTVGAGFRIPAGPIRLPLPPLPTSLPPVPGPTTGTPPVPPPTGLPPLPGPTSTPTPTPGPWIPNLPGPAEFPFARESGATSMAQPRITDALREIGANARLSSDARAERVWQLNEGGDVGLRTRVEVETEQPPGSWELIFRPDGSLERRTAALHGAAGLVYAEYPDLQTSKQTLTNLESSTQLDGRWVRTRQGENPRARPTDGDYLFAPEPVDPLQTARRAQLRLFDPDFLEVNVYYHVNRTHELMRGYGCEFADYPVVCEVLDSNGSENAEYHPSTRSIHFFSLSRFHPAADNSVVCHEYGHALFHALQREVTYSGESAAVNEGFADFVAGLVTGSSLIGAHHFTAKPGHVARDMANGATYPERRMDEAHSAGTVWAGLGWDLRRELGVDAARTLMFGAIQLAPRPVDFRGASIGLLLSDRFFNNDRNKELLRRQLARRGLEL